MGSQSSFPSITMLVRSLLSSNNLTAISRTPPLRRTWTSLTRTSESLTVHALNDTTFPYIWLRDSCQSPESVNSVTGSKRHRTADIPLNIAPIESENGIQVTETGLQILWKDGRRSRFEREWLQVYASAAVEEKFHDTLKPQLWTRDSFPPISTLSFPYHEILSSDEHNAKAIEQLCKYGVVFIHGVPNEETSDEKCELWRLAEKFGDVRKTFYGIVWDVVKLKDGNNVGYTDMPLGLHQDLLFYEHPPRYQILHCLRNKAIGGSNFIVDGLYTSQLVRATHPADFDILTKTPVPFQYIHDGRHAHQNHFTIALAPPTLSSFRQEVSHVNYSPHEQGPLAVSTPKEFYLAFKRFSDLLEDETHKVRFSPKEGDAVIWDNRRLVHGRTGFRSMTEEERKKSGVEEPKEGEPDRLLKGCYLGVDAVLDRVRALKTRLAMERGRA